jgi:hypothetical protein
VIVSVPEAPDRPSELFNLVIDAGVATTDGPIGAPLGSELPGYPETYAWVYAEPAQGSVSAVEVAIVADSEACHVMAGSLTEARFSNGGEVVVRAGGCLGVSHSGLIGDKALFDVLDERARACPDAPADQDAAFAHLQSIVRKVLAFNMSDAAQQ